MRRAFRMIFWFFRPPRKISFTREGWIFTAFTLPVGFAAINTGNNMLYLVLGMLLSIIVLNGVLSESSIKRLTLASRLPPNVTAGAPLICFAQLTNGKRFFPSYLVRVTHHWQESRRRRSVREAPEPKAQEAYTLLLGPGETQTIRLHSVIPKRGAYTLTGYRLATRFPFGLFDKSREIEEEGKIIVFPRPVPFGSETNGSSADRGEIDREQRGMGGELYALRPYRSDDDARHIHWKLSARVGEPIVREYAATGKQSCVIFFDTRLRPGINPERFERAVSHVAYLVEQARQEGIEVGLYAPGADFPSEAGESHYEKLMTFLATVSPAEEFASFARPVSGQDVLYEVSADGAGVGERVS